MVPILLRYECQLHVGIVQDGNVVLSFPCKVSCIVSEGLTLIHFIDSNIVVRVVKDPDLGHKLFLMDCNCLIFRNLTYLAYGVTKCVDRFRTIE